MDNSNVLPLKKAPEQNQQPAGEFPRLPGESVDAWEKRFLKTLPDSDIKKLFVTRTQAFKNVGAQLAHIKNEMNRRGITNAKK